VEAVNVVTRPSYRRSIKRFSRNELAEINAAIARLPEAFRNSHVHAGLGIRKLRPSLFEFRAGLDIRVLLVRESRDYVLVFAGNHDEVRAWLKANA
jgi:hypothetical protein